MFSRIYIHIPFCRSKCPYCAFVSNKADEVQIADYTELLAREAELAKRAFPTEQQIDSVYFGGGTPSLLTPGQIEKLLTTLQGLFRLTPRTEITLEANPGTVDHEQLTGFHSAGVNRLSLGVQSFDDAMLARIGRIHTAQQARDAFKTARRAGFDNIGIDLIHGLPEQTMEQWLADIRQGISLSPEHLSVYGLTVEEGTPFDKQYSGSPLLPDSDLSADMFEAADSELIAADYEHYEIANYARPGLRSRHNSGYWRRDGYLGLGAAAHSFIKVPQYGRRFSNSIDLEEYCSGVRQGHLPQQNITELDRDDSLSEFIYLGLRMADGINLDDFKEQFNCDMQILFAAELKELAGYGLLKINGNNIRLTLKGMLLSNQVFSRFLR